MTCAKKEKKELTPLEQFFDMVIGDYLGVLEDSYDDMNDDEIKEQEKLVAGVKEGCRQAAKKCGINYKKFDVDDLL